VKIELKKRIPTEAGLAGGSSDASAVLRGLNRLFSVNLLDKELETLSAILGSDMPYCIKQKLSLCTGRGEKVQVLTNINYKTYDVKLEEDIFNDLTKPAININKQLKLIIKQIKDENISAFMSGSGPTLFMFNLSEHKVKILENKLKNVKFFRTKLKM